jgi:hypothetical protein
VKRSPKIVDVLKTARECIEAGRYYDTTHARLRKSQRQISLAHVLYVIKNGYHEKSKDQYHAEYSDWTYSVRGKTIDKKDIRIAIAFDKDDMLIITVIQVARVVE